MREVPVHEAVGLVLGHDITEISVERRVKQRAFRRGHRLAHDDIARLLDLGKSTVFIHDPDDTDVHEDDAAMLVAPAAAGDGVRHDPEPCEGKVTFTAERSGVLRVDAERLLAINSLAIPALPTLPTNYPVRQDQTVAAFRIIPLTCERAVIDAVLAQLTEPLLRVDPYIVRSAGVLVTGTEVFEGRITDGFIPRLERTLAGYDVPVTARAVAPDDRALIRAEIERLTAACDLVLVTGGTSVDPDDITVQAMADAGVSIAVKGMPVQPGNNFTVGYRDGTPVCAVPAASLHYRATALDLLLPRILAGERLTVAQIAAFGLGGLAQPTTDDHFPDTTFGAGGWR